MMAAPTGLGIWVAFQPPRSAERIVAARASWVAPRAGFDGWNDAHFHAADLLAYSQAGLAVYPWIYPTMAGWRGAVAGFVKLWQTGHCAGLIVDWEAEWCGPDAAENDREARAFVAALRAALPGVFIASAPMDYRSNHPTAPWAAFDELDAAMPQVYAWEHDDRGHAFHVARVMPQWAHTGKPTWPIGCSYRPRFRGVDADKHPLPTPPLSSDLVVADVLAFLDSPTLADGPISLYSLEACGPGVEAALVARCTGTGTSPRAIEPGLQLGDGNAPNDLYVTDRATAQADSIVASTVPGTPTAKRISSQRLAATRAPILGVDVDERSDTDPAPPLPPETTKE